LKGDHTSLSLVTQDLMEVQSAMADAEQSIFGKVLNVERVRSLYAQHEQVEAMNANLRKEVQALRDQVVAASRDLAGAHKAFLDQDQAVQLGEQRVVSFLAQTKKARQRQQQLRATEARLLAERQAAQAARERELERRQQEQKRAREMQERRQRELKEMQERRQQELLEQKRAKERQLLAQRRAKEAAAVRARALRLPYDEAQHEMLKMDRQHLLNQSAEAANRTKASLHALLPLREALEQEEQAQAPLRQQVLELHQNATVCHGLAGQLSQKLKAEQNALPVELAASTSAREQWTAARKATSQRLRAEEALLADQVRRSDAAGHQALAMLAQSKTRLELVERKIIEGIHDLKSQKNATKEHMHEVNRSLVDNLAAKEVDQQHRHDVHKRLVSLQMKLSPTRYTMLQSQNQAYQGELDSAQAMLQQAKAGEALTSSTLEQLQGEHAAMQTQVNDTAASLVEAETEGQRQIRLAIQEAEAGQQNAASLVQQAEETLEAKCRVKWEERTKTKEEEVKACEAKKAELTVVQAQRDTLEETLKSQQTSAAASTGGGEATE